MNTLLVALIMGVASTSLMAHDDAMLLAFGEPTSARNVERAEHWQEGLLGTYSATFDLGLLTASDARSSASSATPVHVARRSLSALLPGSQTPVRLDFTTIYEGTDGVVTHAGTVAGDDGSLVTLSIQGNEVLGKIHAGGLLYLLEGSVESGHTLSVIDSARLPGSRPRPDDRRVHSHAHDEGKPTANRRNERPEPATRSSGGNVATLILYTPAVAARNNISVLANEIIAEANASLSASGVDSSNYFTLADLKPLSNNFATFGVRCRDEVLDQARFRFGAFSGMDALMSSAQADTALILVTTEPTYDECLQNVGRVGGVAVTHEDEYPFALSTDTYALGDLTAIHEIGHVLGGDHEGGSNGVLPNAYGFAEESSCGWQTLMGGYVACDFDEEQPFPQFQTTTRLPRWSNPNMNYGTVAMGSSTQNMADALEMLMPTVSAWESDPAAPGSASGFAVSSWLCYGTHTASWSATTGATHYQLMASTSVTFSSPYLIQIASGATSAIFDIQPSETLYLRVRACNAGGCGGYSGQQVANSYYPVCI